MLQFSVAILLTILVTGTAARRLNPLDCAMLSVLVYEIALSLLSRYSANGVRIATSVAAATLLYIMARIAVGSSRQAVTMAAALIGTGGVALGGFAQAQFNRNFRELQAVGLADAVTFRYRLISPPAPWVLGEWFTLVLTTLPFAFGVAVFSWLAGRRKLAVVSLFATAVIAAALALSCSRAVFWAVAVFFVSVFAIGAVYEVFPIRVAGVGSTAALFALAAFVFAENSFYSGVLEAYAGGHTSQVRSTEGRLAIWKRSADIFRLSPLWGIGAGNAPLFLTGSADEDQTTGFASRTFSLPVQLLTEKGVIGTALYLAVLVMAGWEAHRKLRNPKVSPQIKGMTCCLAAGVVAVLFRELTYSSLLEHSATAMLFAMSLALLVAKEPACDT